VVAIHAYQNSELVSHIDVANMALDFPLVELRPGLLEDVEMIRSLTLNLILVPQVSYALDRRPRPCYYDRYRIRRLPSALLGPSRTS
jgi:hypothetical protein